MTDDHRAATYLYCVVQRRTRPSVAGASRGLPGAGRPRVLPAGPGLWLVVADAPLARYGAESIERGLSDLEWVSRCAVAHEAVVEHFGRGAPVVPVKLFTLFSGDARAVAHVGRGRRRLERLFARIAGRGEWSVRLGLDARRRPRGVAAGAGGPSGTAFLQRKQADRQAQERRVAEAVQEADRVFDDLARRADEARRRTPEQGASAVRMVLDAVFLVPARRAAAFRAAVAGLAGRLAGDGYVLTLTGPWPPYTFVAELG